MSRKKKKPSFLQREFDEHLRGRFAFLVIIVIFLIFFAGFFTAWYFTLDTISEVVHRTLIKFELADDFEVIIRECLLRSGL